MWLPLATVAAADYPTMMQRVRELCVLALFLLSVAAPVFTQIHFSPTWGTGKRSDPALSDTASDTCWTLSDLRALLQMVRMVEVRQLLLLRLSILCCN